ncbi:MAG TPA: endonuclease [Streptomyces sp.]|uniref:endonuclease n=1 Tax=Streptomyces sp. TaxID=1931 RepID=UPI002D26F430|nr:endonuclease [Streptomyces sp.]HZG04062.1 endonuclease [Streptomyces sp.]
MNETTGKTARRDQERNAATVRALLDRYGRTYAQEAGILLRNTPVPLYRLLVLSLLLSARIRADTAVAAARALFDAGLGDARRMAESTWQQRVDALGAGGYRRYDERTATQLGDGAELLLQRYRGDLRRLREESGVSERLQRFPGIGPTGADIFLREAQGVWPEFAPYIDRRARDGAERLGLPSSARALARLVPGEDLPRLAAGLVRAALDRKVAEEVRAAAEA